MSYVSMKEFKEFKELILGMLSNNDIYNRQNTEDKKEIHETDYNQTNKIDENDGAICDVADLSDENSASIEDLAEMIDDLEQRVSALEGKDNG